MFIFETKNTPLFRVFSSNSPLRYPRVWLFVLQYPLSKRKHGITGAREEARRLDSPVSIHVHILVTSRTLRIPLARTHDEAMLTPPSLNVFRTAAFLSLREVANRLKVPLHTWYTWERRNLIPPSRLDAVAQALGADPAVLRGLTGLSRPGRPPRTGGLPETRPRLRG